MQGGVRNYLGKQKIVKAPKKWKSSPDHPDTELAYITPEEKNILIKLNLYDSMNGKANKGPSGLPSLQGGGWGSEDKGGDRGHTSGGGGGGQDHPDRGWQTYVAPAPAPAPVFQPPQREPVYTAPTPEPDTRDYEEQAVGTPFENIYTAPTSFAPTTGEGGLGGGDYIDPQTLQDMEDIASWSAEEDVPLDKKHIKDTQKEIKEGIKNLEKDYDVKLTKEQKKQVNTELTTYYGAKPGTRYDLTDFGADKAWGQKKSGILSTLGDVALTVLSGGSNKLVAGLAKGVQAKRKYDKFQKSAFGQKLGLKEFDASNLKDKIKLDKELAGAEYWKRGDVSKKKLVREPGEGEGAGAIPPTLAEEITGRGLESGQKMLGLDPERIQQIYQGRDLLKQTIESGMYQGRQLNMNEIKILQEHMMKLDNLIQNIESYQVRTGSAHGGRIDKALGGRSRDI